MRPELKSVHPVLASRNVAASIHFFRGLGFDLLFQDSVGAPKYAVVQRDGVQLHLQWGTPDQWANPGDRPVYRFLVNDVDALYDELAAAGSLLASASHTSPWAKPANTPWGTREFHVRDPDGNGLQFYIAGK